MPVQTTTVRHFQVPSAHTHTRARTHTHTRARAHAHTHAVLGSSTRSTSAPRPKAPATPGGDCQQRRKHVADSASAADIHPPAPLGWITAASSLQRRIPKAPATPKGAVPVQREIKAPPKENRRPSVGDRSFAETVSATQHQRQPARTQGSRDTRHHPTSGAPKRRRRRPPSTAAAPRPPVPHIPVEGSEGRPQQPAAGHGTHSPRRGLLLKFAVYCLTGLDCPLMNVSAHSEHVGLWVVLRLALCIFSCLV